MGWVLALVMLLALGLPAAAQGDQGPPEGAAPAPSVSPAEETDGAAEACLEVVRGFVQDLYDRRWSQGLARVRGVEGSEAKGEKFVELIQDILSSHEYRNLADCGYNLFALAVAIESREAPASLDGLKSAFPQGLPTCPAGGVYGYQRSKEGYRLWCGTGAHERIGIGGDFPAFSQRGGLSLGNQKLHLAALPDFEIRDWRVEVEDHDEELDLYRIRHVETSRLGPRSPFLERSSTFVLSNEGGEWRIDLSLSNRDMVFVFDEDEFTRTATMPRQILYYYQASSAVGFQLPDVEDRAHLELRVCEANLRSLSLAVEQWSVQHGGDYPSAAERVATPRLLREMPQCPAGGTYRYRPEDPGSYRIWCDGGVHKPAGVPPGYPALTPVLGVMEAP